MKQVPHPIFIIGTPHSGNTLLSWALAQHPSFSHVLETEWLVKLATDLEATFELATSQTNASQFVAQALTPGAFYQAFGEALNGLFSGENATSDQPRRWVDCTPSHAFHVAGLLRLFPNARFIHTVGDAETVVKLLVNQLGGSRGVPYTAATAEDLWLRTTRAALDAEMAYGSETVLRLHQKWLLRQPEETLRRCLYFLEEPYRDECLRPLRGVSDLSTGSDLGLSELSGGVAISEEAAFLSRLLDHEVAQHYTQNPERMAELDAAFRQLMAKPSRDPFPILDGSLTSKVKDAVRTAIPGDANVLVVTKGDDQLLDLNVNKAGHFPQDPDGQNYAGYHPANSSDAIEHLEQLKMRGNEYFVIPCPYYWWLDHYAGFREHLVENYRMVFYQEDSCMVFALKGQRAEDQPSLKVQYVA
jgi:Sulfotransferase family